jgi:hypothetical protein
VLPGAALDAADEQQARPRRSRPDRSSSPSRRTEAASGPEIGSIMWGGGAGEWRKKWEGDSKRENEWRL